MTIVPNLKESLAAKRKAGRPQTIRYSERDLVTLEPLSPVQALPQVVRSQYLGVRLDEWVVSHRSFIEENLLKAGAILFRGFNVSSLQEFERMLQTLCPNLMNYIEGATPRKELKDKLYTSTEFPAEHSIALHNELSYVTSWPMRLFFCCVIAAEEQGETPIADVRKVHSRIPHDIREKFAEMGWMLVRNYGDGFALPWQTAFHTNDKAHVEEYCRKNLIDFEWKGGDRLRTRQVRSAIQVHPITHDLVWFNHVAFWHISSVEPRELREELQRQMAPDELPYNTFYGDGSAIEPVVAEALREAYRREQVQFSWEVGDLLMIDNMLVAHGRSPYRGSRQILAAMGDACTFAINNSGS